MQRVRLSLDSARAGRQLLDHAGYHLGSTRVGVCRNLLPVPTGMLVAQYLPHLDVPLALLDDLILAKLATPARTVSASHHVQRGGEHGMLEPCRCNLCATWGQAFRHESHCELDAGRVTRVF